MSNYTKQPQKARNNNHKKDVFCQEHLGPSHLDWKSKVFFETTISPRLSATTCSIHQYYTYIRNIHQHTSMHHYTSKTVHSFFEFHSTKLAAFDPCFTISLSWILLAPAKTSAIEFNTVLRRNFGSKKGGEFPSLRSAASKCHQLNCQDFISTHLEAENGYSWIVYPSGPPSLVA